jgi:prepilin-type N-terminal cleavage/methylation domain-containing protein
MRLRTARAATAPDEAGFSLIELMMVLLLLGVVLPVGYSAVASSQKAVADTENRFASVSQAQLAMDSMTRDIRAIQTPLSGANAIVSATANDIQFYSSVFSPSSGYPALVELKLTTCSGCTTTSLVEDTIMPVVSGSTVSYPAASMVVRTLAANVVIPVASPTTDCSAGGAFTPGLFSYSTISVSGVTSCDPLSTSSTPPALAAAELPKIAMVTVSVTTKLSATAASTAVVDTVYLLNNLYGTA